MFKKLYILVSVAIFSVTAAEDALFKSKLSLIMQLERNPALLLTIEQISALDRSNDSLAPRDIVVNLNYSEIQKLCQALLMQGNVSGLRIMLSGSEQDSEYNVDTVVHGKVFFGSGYIIFAPLAEYGEKTPLMMRYNEQDLIGLSDSVGDKNSASYCIDISDSKNLQKFVEILTEKCLIDGKMELPDLSGLLELVVDVKEQFSEQITVL